MIGKHITKFSLTSLLLTTCFTSAALAEEWKGIIPGVSTRSDIVRLFQECKDNSLPCEFELEGNKVRIVFSGMVQDYFYPCSTNLPSDTVLVVEVTPRTKTKLKSLQQSFHFRKLGAMSQFSGYADERAGLILKTHKNVIIQLNYIADASTRLRCEAYYANPTKFVPVVTHCPPITLEGPSATVTAGDVVHLKANIQPDPKMTLVWKIKNGKILARSGRQISIDTTGLGGQTLNVTVQAVGSCSVENSLTLNIQP